MVGKASARRRTSLSSSSDSRADYDYLKEILKIAHKNGWDTHTLGLVPKDLPANPAQPLKRREFEERNRLVKTILKRFEKVLTPPVPPDLEKSIRSKNEESWLPWQAEAIEKLDAWRQETLKMKPAILRELKRLLDKRASSEAPDNPVPQ